MARTFDVVLPKRRVEKDTEVNTAQRASGDFARHLLANFYVVLPRGQGTACCAR